jgi:cysteinyl-tRNA synthetase
MITVRQVHRANGDYAKSDEVRDALLSNGIIIKDLPDSALWSRQ